VRERTPYEMAVQEAKKVARSFIRLRYSILAERELNTALPAIEREIAEALERGQAYELEPRRFFQGLPE